MAHVTLEQLYNEPRFRKMGERELADWILNGNSISWQDYNYLPPTGVGEEKSIAKARNLIAKWKAEEKPLRLCEGMGVVNATLHEGDALYSIANRIFGGDSVYSTSHPNVSVKKDHSGKWYITSSMKGYEHVVTHPVTFREFCQAILNEPEKPKEETVKLNDSHTAIVTKDTIKVGCQSFPIFVIDDLVAARDKVSK